jgi:hypothetical protein
MEGKEMCIDAAVVKTGSEETKQIIYLVDKQQEELHKVKGLLPEKFQPEIVFTTNGIGLSFMSGVGWPDDNEIFLEIGEILDDSVRVIPFIPI